MNLRNPGTDVARQMAAAYDGRWRQMECPCRASNISRRWSVGVAHGYDGSGLRPVYVNAPSAGNVAALLGVRFVQVFDLFVSTRQRWKRAGTAFGEVRLGLRAGKRAIHEPGGDTSSAPLFFAIPGTFVMV
jgi:hypothetical protein